MTTTSTPKRRPGGRTARVARQVYDATLRILECGEYERLTMSEIAKESGVHLSTLYRRWESLDGVLLDLVPKISNERMPLPATGALETDLIEFQRSSVRYIRSNIGRTLITRGPIANPQTLQRYWAHRFEALQPMFDKAIERGEIAADADVTGALDALTGTLYFRVLFRSDDAEDEALVQATVRTALAVLGLTPTR